MEDLRGVPAPTTPESGSSKEDREAAHRIQRRARQWQTLTRDHQGSWMEAIHYVSGRTNVYWSQKLQRLRPEPALPRRSFHRANFLIRMVEQLLSVLLREDAEPDVIPTSTSFEAWERAENTKVVLKHNYRVGKIADVREEVYRWSLITGIGWMRWGWDPNAGDRLRQHVFETFTDKEGFRARRPSVVDGIPQTVDSFTGAPYARCVSPFNIIVDIASMRLTERGVFQPRYVIEQNLYPVTAIETAYPKFKGKIKPDRTLESNHIRELLFSSGLGAGNADDSEQVALVYEEWTPWTALSSKERKKHPNGRVVKMCQGHILEKYDNPYNGKMPFVPFPCYPVLGRFLPQGIIPHLIPQQMAYNRLAGKEHDALVYAVPKFIWPRRERKGEGHIRTDPGEIVNVDIRETGGAMPHWTNTPEVSSQFSHKQAVIKNEMQDISAIHEALQGQNPPGGRSGRLAFANIQANLLSHQRLERSYSRRMAEVFDGIAFCERAFGFASRTFSIIGSEAMMSKTLVPMESVEYADIQIRDMSAMSISEPARIEFVMNLWASGALVDDLGRPDVVEFRRMLKLGSTSSSFEEEMMVRRNTQREIELIVAGGMPHYGPGPDGQPLFLNPAANLEVVHRVYRAFINSAKYLTMPPMMQRRILDRWDMIIQRLQGEVMEATNQEGQPSPGGPSPAAQVGPAAASGGGIEAGLSKALSSKGQGGPF